MTATCPLDGHPLEEDLVFRRDCASYGVARTRLVCLAGHSIYQDLAPPSASRPQPWRTCTRCGEPITRGRLCETCASPQTLAQRLAEQEA